MAKIAGTATRYDLSKGIRESLSDVIYNISPEDTPFMSSAGRGPKAKNTFEEWQTDSLAAPDTSNAQVEGDETAFSTPSDTVRLGNYTQISKKSLIVSGTLEAVDKAGKKSEVAYQMAKKSAELKRDQESILLSNQAANAGSATVARKTGSLLAFLKTNVDKGVGGANPTYTSSPTGSRTDGTARAFTEAMLKGQIQSVYTQGGTAKVLMVPPGQKPVVSGFSGIATRNFDISRPQPTAIIAAADVYVSDFGTLRVVPNRFERSTDALLLDFDMVELRYLRPYFTETLAKTGDAEKRHIIGEYVLVVKQEAGLGLVTDLS